MPHMYFSGEENENLNFDDPASECIRVNPTVFTKVQNDNEQNARVFLDTHLLRIRDYRPEDEFNSEKIERIVPKSDASVSVETRALIPALNFVSNLMTVADFKEMSSNEFKTTYLAPLDNALRESNIKRRSLLPEYTYPFGDATLVEDDIQRYFDGKIADTINELYRDISGRYHYFGRSSIIKPPLDRRRRIKPDIIHLVMNERSPNQQNPELCFGIGDYKKKNYYLAQGFEELKLTLENYKMSLQNSRSLRSQSTHTIFEDREWTPRVVCALVLRKYIYQAFLCGTDRVFISDHQSFSGFFKYKFVDDKKMTIDYYIINDPETVKHGITLRSAIAGFFYEERKDAVETKQRLITTFEVASKTKGSDPFVNVVPRPVEEPSQERKRSRLSGSELRRELKSIEENTDYDNFDEIRGNTSCRIVYDARKCYPGLGYILPTDVFVKLYNYPESAIENFPEKDSYYDMFVNELEINKILAKSQFASYFPKLIISGYLNGVPSQPMHIFEDLGEELPMSKWDYNKVQETIKLRLEEIHLLGICHNDVRAANIHVSVSGRISLIDFGLSTYPSGEECKRIDFEALDNIFRAYAHDIQEEEHDNREDAVIFDNLSKESQSTCVTKDDVRSKGFAINKKFTDPISPYSKDLNVTDQMPIRKNLKN